MASLYIPLINPPTNIPSHVSLSPTVPWHSSALLSAAMETSVLATRLKSNVIGRMSLGDIAAFLDRGRKQNIAMLSMAAGIDSEKDVSQLNKLTSLSWTHPKAQKKPHVFTEYLTRRAHTEDDDVKPETNDDDDYQPSYTRFVRSCKDLVCSPSDLSHFLIGPIPR